MYLTEEIPPCTPVAGSSVDPCEMGAKLLNTFNGSVSQSTVDPPSVPYSVGDYLDGFGWWEYGIGHLVVRGTYLPGTVRCTSGNNFSVPPHLLPGEDETPTVLDNALFIHCYADVRVNDYIVGTGPSMLTVVVGFEKYGAQGQSYYAEGEVEALRAIWERALNEGGRQVHRPYLHVVTGPSEGITGREAMLFLGPSSDASIESWEVYATWDVQRQEDGTVVAVHPDSYFYEYQLPNSYDSLRSRLVLTLPAFTQAATAAHQARVTANGGRTRPDPTYPMLVTDANQLSSYFREVGAYDDPANPPAQPPPSSVTQ